MHFTNCPSPRFTILSGSPPALALDPWGTVYLATEGGLLRVHPNAPTISVCGLSPMACPASKRSPSSITSEGRIWFASGHRLGWLDSQDHVHIFPAQSGLPHETVIGIFRTSRKFSAVFALRRISIASTQARHISFPSFPIFPPRTTMARLPWIVPAIS